MISPQTTKPVDLLALVDPGLDVVSGEWKRDGAGFMSDLLSTNSCLRLPVEPGEAFSLRVAFSTSHGNFFRGAATGIEMRGTVRFQREDRTVFEAARNSCEFSLHTVEASQ